MIKKIEEKLRTVVYGGFEIDKTLEITNREKEELEESIKILDLEA
jgi:hypothetical protein